MSTSSLSAPEPSRVSQAWVSPLLRAVGALIVVAPFLPPLFALSGHPTLAEVFDAPFTGMCHRMPERSLFIGSEVMPLCTRCLGLFEGLGLGLLIAWPFYGLRVLRITLSLAATFLFLELTTQDLGWHPVFHPTRLLSGFLASYPIGAAAGALARRLS